MKKRSANVLGAREGGTELSSIDAGRHKLNINSGNVTTSSKFHAPSVSSYSVTDSSYLLGQSTAVGGGKPDIAVESLALDEGIKY